MGDEGSAAVPDDGEWDRADRDRSPGEASDAEVRAAVESVGGQRVGVVPTARASSADAGSSTGTAGDGAVPSGAPGVDPPDTGECGKPAIPSDGRPDPGPGPGPGRESGDATDASARDDLTPTVATVGGGIGLLTTGVLVVTYRTLVVAGADRTVAALYGVGGLLIVGSFVAHALRHADGVDDRSGHRRV